MFKSIVPTIFVTDLDRAVTFYTEALGLKLAFHEPGKWAAVLCGDGSNIGLHPAGEHSPRPGTGGSIQVGLIVGEPIESVVKRLESRGVQFNGPIINDDDAVKLAFFGDPDGNELYLCQTQPPN